MMKHNRLESQSLMTRTGMNFFPRLIPRTPECGPRLFLHVDSICLCGLRCCVPVHMLLAALLPHSPIFQVQMQRRNALPVMILNTAQFDLMQRGDDTL